MSDTCLIQGCSNPRHATPHRVFRLCLEHYKAKTSNNHHHHEVGTRTKESKGYVRVKTETGWRNEHSLVMEQKLGRPMVKGETVHHINGIRDDNRPENLELWIGGVRYGQRARDLLCPHCGSSYAVE